MTKNGIRLAQPTRGAGRNSQIVDRHRGTPIMRLVSVALADAGPLDRFIAARRVPGDNWLRWPDIAHAVSERLDGVVDFSGESVRQWAIALGIPQDTTKNGGALERGAFIEAVSTQGIPYTV